MTEHKTHFSIPVYQHHTRYLEKKHALNKFGIALADTLKEIILTHILLDPLDKERIDIQFNVGPNWKPVSITFGVKKIDDEDKPDHIKKLQVQLDGFFQDLDNMFKDVYELSDDEESDAYTPSLYTHSRIHVMRFPNPWEILSFIGNYLEYFQTFITPDQIEVEVNYDEKSLEFQPLSERYFTALPLTQIATRNMVLDFAKAMGSPAGRKVVNICPGYLEGCLEEAYKHVPPENVFNLIN